MTATILDELRRTGPTWNGGAATATREIKIAGSDIQNLMEDLLGATFVAGQGFRITQKVRHPEHNWMILTGLNFDHWEPEKPPVSGTVYEFRKAILTYTGKLLEANGQDDTDPDTPAGTYLTHDMESSVEMMTIPSHGFVWATAPKDPLPDNVEVGIKIPTTTHRLTWDNVVEPPFAAMHKLIGCTNNATIFGCVAETIMFAGYGSNRVYDTDGWPIYTIHYEFIEKNISYKDGGVLTSGIGWNHFYRPGAAVPWQRIENAETGETQVYPAEDLTELFNFAAIAE